MPTAFPGPYTDLSLTTREPFDQVSQAEDVKNPRDLGENRSYRIDRAASPREVDLSAQQTDPKPSSRSRNWPLGYNPYATGGCLEAYLDNAAS